MLKEADRQTNNDKMSIRLGICEVFLLLPVLFSVSPALRQTLFCTYHFGENMSLFELLSTPCPLSLGIMFNARVGETNMACLTYFQRKVT